MQLKFKCNKKDFQKIESFFCEQEYTEKPPFDEIILEVDNQEYYYHIKQEFGHWYIVI